MYNDSIFKTNYNYIIDNVDTFSDVYRRNGILIFEQLHASEEEQYNILSLLGDNLGWNPNPRNKDEIQQWLRYEENHSVSIGLREKFGAHPLDESILIHWHLEHIENDVHQVAAAWNMLKNEVANPSDGATGFVNCYAENLNPPEHYLEFLKKTTIKCTENPGWDMGWDSCQRPAVCVHKNTKKDVIRICPLGHVQTVVSIDGNEPSNSDQELMNEINWWFLDKVWKDEAKQFWWEWNTGDLIIPDLTVMAHAVKIGFNHTQRNFVGYWAFGDDYQKRIDNPLNT